MLRSFLIRRGPAALGAVLTVLVASAGAASASEPEWNIARIGGSALASGVVIAVIDTGVDGTHPALSGRVLPTIDLVGDGSAGDPNGHGTHVAGTAAGADAGCGAIGVAPDARILPVRVLDADGEGTTSGVAQGIRAATDAGASVINLSLSSDVVLRNASGSGLEEALDYAWSKGVISVLAAGNDALLGGLFGSGYGDVPAVVVTATDNQNRSPSYATAVGSADWGIAAPGGDGSQQRGADVMSAYPGNQCALSAGTSMAAPHVSGALAVLRARGLSARAAVDRILATARDLGSASTFGAGLLDLRAALAGTSSSSTAPTTAPSTSPTTRAPVSPSPTVGRRVPTTSPGATQPGVSRPAAEGDLVAPTTGSVPLFPRSPGRSDPQDRAAAPDSPMRVMSEGDDAGPPTLLVGLAMASLGVVGVAAVKLRRR